MPGGEGEGSPTWQRREFFVPEPGWPLTAFWEQLPLRLSCVAAWPMDAGEASTLTGKTFQSLLPVGARLEAEICLVRCTFSGLFGEPWHFLGNASGSPNGTVGLFIS